MGKKKTTNNIMSLKEKPFEMLVIGEESSRRAIKKYRNAIMKSREESNVLELKENSTLKNYEVILQPPYDLEVLSVIPEISSILPQCIEAMKQNVEGYGYSLISKVKELDETQKKEFENEKDMVDEFFDNISYEYDFTSLRKLIRQDYEIFGNAYIEIIRNNKGEISGFEYVPAISVFATLKDSEYTEYEVKRHNKRTGDIITEKRRKQFRRYIQVSMGQQIYFKEYQDPRKIDAKTGKVIDEETYKQYRAVGEEVKEATEIYHFKMTNTAKAYGVPRWIGVLLPILGNRAAEQINYDYFDNKAVPPLALLVEGGEFTKDTIDRIETYVDTNLKGRNNFHKILILEALDQQAKLEGTQDKTKISIKELSQVKEGQFLEYIEKNDKKIRSAFRLPPLYIGLSDDYTRATAAESREIAEEQVFQPERAMWDDFINKKILPYLGIKYVRFKTNASPKQEIFDYKDLLKVFNEVGLTPREIRKLIDSLTDIELEDYGKDDSNKWLDIPMPLAKQVVTQEQITKSIDKFLNRENLEKESDVDDINVEKFVEKLVLLREKLHNANTSK